MQTLQIIVGSSTDAGSGHDENEDAVGEVRLRMGHVLIVADGMGGKQGGSTASKVAVNAIGARLSTSSDAAMTHMELKDALEHAHQQVQRLGSFVTTEKRMGAACAVAIIADGAASIGHTGDARIYRVLRSGSIARLTRDMTVLQDRLDDAELEPHESYGHPDGRVLRGYLGQQGRLKSTVPRNPIPLQPGDHIVLCTDGITSVVTDEEIAHHVVQRKPQEAADALVILARQRGSRDDATIVIALVSDPVSAEVRNEPEPTGVSPSIEPSAPKADTKPPTPLAIGPMPAPMEPFTAPPPRSMVTTIAFWVIVVAALGCIALAALILLRDPPSVRTVPLGKPISSETTEPQPDTLADTPEEEDPYTDDDDDLAENTEDIAAAALPKPDTTTGTEQPTAKAALGIAALLDKPTATSFQMRQILTGELRMQLLQAGRPAQLPHVDSLPLTMPDIFRVPAPDIETDPALRASADKLRARILMELVTILIQEADITGLRDLEAQLTYRSEEPHVARMLLQFVLLKPDKVLTEWAYQHLRVR